MQSLMDGDRVITLTFLDQSAAFNTIEHTILLWRPDAWFGATGQALDWFKSYLTGRWWRIKVLQICSPFLSPSRVILGPLLFTIYPTPFSSIILEHNVNHHLYTDHSQLYVFFASDNSTAVWMVYNCAWPPCLGCRWINWIWIQTKPNSSLSGANNSGANFSLRFPLKFLVSRLTQQNQLQILVEIFDKTFTLHSHIFAACISSFYHI